MKRRVKILIAATAALYAAALALSWDFCTRAANRRLDDLLEFVYRDYCATFEDIIGTMLIHSGLAVLDEISDFDRSRTAGEMKRLADRYLVDEINFIGPDHITRASNIPGLPGYDYADDPKTREYLKLDPVACPLYIESFRHGVSNPDAYMKYIGLAGKDGSSVQLGIDMRRFLKGSGYFDQMLFDDWQVSQHGFVMAAEKATEYFADRGIDLGRCPDGKISRVRLEDGVTAILPFTHVGRRLVIVIPEADFLEERNYDFLVLIPVLTLFIVLLALIAAITLRNAEREKARRRLDDERLHRDLKLGAEIQSAALPSVRNELANVYTCDFDAVFRAAKEVGGDFYDFYPVGEGRFAFTIADVSGKGVPAAMFMMRAKNELKNAVLSGAEIAEAVVRANAALCVSNGSRMFVTVFLGLLDLGSGTFEYVNAGHNPPLLKRADGTVERITDRGGKFLGIFPKAKFRSSSLRFAKNDALLLYTDGVTEAMNPGRELYGDERLKQVFAAASDDPAATLAAVSESVAAFSAGAEQADDLTAVAVRWRGTGEVHQQSLEVGPDTLSKAFEFVAETSKRLPPDVCARLRTAADELLTNIVSYSGAKKLKIVIVTAPGRVRLTLIDDGIAFNPIERPSPDCTKPLSVRPIGGLGILMVKKLFDDICYRRMAGVNVLTVSRSSL